MMDCNLIKLCLTIVLQFDLFFASYTIQIIEKFL